MTILFLVNNCTLIFYELCFLCKIIICIAVAYFIYSWLRGWDDWLYGVVREAENKALAMWRSFGPLEEIISFNQFASGVHSLDHLICEIFKKNTSEKGLLNPTGTTTLCQIKFQMSQTCASSRGELVVSAILKILTYRNDLTAELRMSNLFLLKGTLWIVYITAIDNKKHPFVLLITIFNISQINWHFVFQMVFRVRN